MSKFNRAMMRKTKTDIPSDNNDKNVKIETSSEREKISLGAGLLSPTSVSAIKEMEIVYIKPSEMYPSEENEISMDENEIEQLADSFLEVGMLNEPIVKKDSDGKYRIVCGEKRYRATLFNIDKGRRDPEETVRCKLFNPTLINLPLSEEEKEDYVRDEENVLQRNKTDADKLMLIRKYEARYKVLRERDPERFKGIKTRDLLVQDLGMSASAIAQFRKIENQGSEELIRAVEEDKVNVTTAVSIAGMEKEEQIDLLSKAFESKKDDEKIVQADVVKYQHDKKTEPKTKTTASSVEMTEISEKENKDQKVIDEKVFKKDLKEILKSLKQNTVVLDDKRYFTYLNAINTLEKLLK